MFLKTKSQQGACLSTALAVLLLVACGKAPPRVPDRPEAAGESPGYAGPPTPVGVERSAAGLVLRGLAPAGAKVRLAPPGGQPVFGQADAQGTWRIVLAQEGEARIYGLSETVAGRQVQAEGYLVVTPQGPAALVRAGAGAVRLDPSKVPAIGAIDYDRDGAALVSGRAPPQSLVFLRLDERQIAEGRVDAEGRYVITLESPVPAGSHVLEVAGDAFQNRVQVQVSPPAPLAAGPMHSQVTDGGLRIDWLTPGGGVQTTILVE